MDEIFNTSTIIIFELIQCKVVKRMLVRNARIHPIRGVSTILTKKAGFLKLLIFHNFNASFQLKIHQLYRSQNLFSCFSKIFSCRIIKHDDWNFWLGMPFYIRFSMNICKEMRICNIIIFSCTSGCPVKCKIANQQIKCILPILF